MQVVSELVILNETKDVAIDFLSREDNLPLWAVEFCQGGQWKNGLYHAQTCMGEMIIKIHVDRETGVVDMLGGPTEEELEPFPMRVVELPGSKSAVNIILVQDPNMPDEVFAGQRASLQKELAGLGAVIRVSRTAAVA
jgi:hypothetical protein